MSDKPDIKGIQADGIGIAKELLNHPDVRRVVELLRSRVDGAVESTRGKVNDEQAVGAFRDALERTLSAGLTEALTKKD